jgi:hypothetical protein
LNNKDIENLNRPIMSNRIESLIKCLPKKKSPRPDCFNTEVYQTFIEELTLILLKLFQKIKREELIQAQSMWTRSSNTETRQENNKKDIYKPISLMNIDATILNKY